MGPASFVQGVVLCMCCAIWYRFLGSGQSAELPTLAALPRGLPPWEAVLTDHVPLSAERGQLVQMVRDLGDLKSHPTKSALTHLEKDTENQLSLKPPSRVTL